MDGEILPDCVCRIGGIRREVFFPMSRRPSEGHSTRIRTTGNKTMNATQSWAGLPDHIKRQAAPDMLAGKGWYHFGRLIEHPGADELRRWAGGGSSPEEIPAASPAPARNAPQNPAPVAGNTN
jgi:hypothetical protein